MSAHLMVGDSLVDIVATPDGARSEHPGGSPANVALTLARPGKRPGLLTWLAEDDHGRAVTAHLTSSGVRVLPPSYGALRTSTALARIDGHGTATYQFDLDWHPPEVELPGNPALVHTGSIAAVAPTEPGDALHDLLHRASTTTTITYDPNLRPWIMGDPHTVRRRSRHWSRQPTLSSSATRTSTGCTPANRPPPSRISGSTSTHARW